MRRIHVGFSNDSPASREAACRKGRRVGGFSDVPIAGQLTWSFRRRVRRCAFVVVARMGARLTTVDQEQRAQLERALRSTSRGIMAKRSGVGVAALRAHLMRPVQRCTVKLNPVNDHAMASCSWPCFSPGSRSEVVPKGGGRKLR